jgi:hypothetical protein
MAYNLKRFETFMSKGLSLFTPDFNADLTMGSTSYNVIQGIRQGMSPRFGFAPIPGQNMKDATLVTTPPTPCGILASESSSDYLAAYRRRFFGVVPLSLASYEDPTVQQTYFAWLNGFHFTSDTDVFFDVGVGSAKVGTITVPGPVTITTIKHVSDVAAGLPSSVVGGTPVSYTQNQPVFQSHPYVSQAALETWMLSPKYYAKFAAMTVSGQEIPQKYVLGSIVAAPTATKTAIPNFIALSGKPLGSPSGYNSRKYKKESRDIVFHVMADDVAAGNPAGLNKTYLYTAQALNDSVVLSALNQIVGTPQLALGNATVVTARLDAVACNFASSNSVLMHDEGNTTNCGYSAILAAAGNAPLCTLIQDWNRNLDGSLDQIVNLTSIPGTPSTSGTYYEGEITSTHFADQNAVPVRTAWINWPEYVRGADIADNYFGAIHTEIGQPPTFGTQITVCENNSGVLRGGQTYEFTYSIYNKRLNRESNVGTPAKLYIPPYSFAAPPGTTDKTIDFVAITMFRNILDAGTSVSKQWHNANTATPFSPLFPRTINGIDLPLNDTEYRVYYRPLGTFEWLPAGNIDASRYWYDATMLTWRVCCGTDSSGLPGGQPGGFNDYSPLPVDNYVDVLSWRARAFWLSATSLRFSNLNNVFGYALRNSVTCPSGAFRGMIVHAYPGQAQQQGRIIVFGSDETYIGRFTGNAIDYPVQVSANNVGSYPLDGSDFVLERWTSITAFSARAAVVAEGDLYYWGPKGVYRDNGTEFPDKLSLEMEPDIFRIYDPNSTDEIFGHYFPETKEIWWVYPPASTLVTVSYALVFNTLTGQFQYCRFTAKLDNIQDLNIEGTAVDRKVAGARHVASVRYDNTKTTSRAYFFDVLNRQGDMSPTTDFLVRTVDTTITPGYARLTMDTGVDATQFNQITVGDKVLLGQYQQYTERTDWVDWIGVVSAKHLSPYYLDVKLPTVTGTPNFSVTLASDKLAPMWTSRGNAITYNFTGNYWTPAGMNWWGNWLFLHHQYKLVTLLSTDTAPTITLSGRTPISKQTLSRTVTLTDNSDGNCQVYSQIFGADQGFEGQGLKLGWGGSYLGHDWILQYVAADTQPMEGDQLQIFEG